MAQARAPKGILEDPNPLRQAAIGSGPHWLRHLSPVKRRFPIGNLGDPRKNADLGLSGYGGICIVNFNKRLAQKLRRIILLHFLTSNF